VMNKLLTICYKGGLPIEDALHRSANASEEASVFKAGSTIESNYIRLNQAQPRLPASDDYFEQHPPERFNVPLDPSFQMLRQFGDHQVFKRIDIYED